MLTETTEVVVIGGGISGTAAAFELARDGVKVTLLEQGSLASMASGWTLAGVRQSGRHPAELPLATAAVARWEQLGAELGADVEYRREGNLRLARSPEEVPVIQGIVAEQRDLGLDLIFLPDNAAVRAVAPAIAESVLAASYCPTDGHANPIATVQAFAVAATRHGATLRTETAATAIDASGGRIHGVRTTGGNIAADVVVVAAGVYTAKLCAPLGLDLPIHVSRVAVVQTVPLPLLIRQVLGTAGADFAGRQEVSGRFRLTGGGKPWPHRLEELAHGEDPVLPPVGDVIAALNRGIEVLPALAGAGVARVWGGLLDMTPDALPIIERTPDLEGLVIAAGFSGHGFCLITSEMTDYSANYEVLQAELAEIGITINLTVVDHAAMHEQIREDVNPIVIYVAYRPNADVYLTNFFHSDSIVVEGASPITNFSHYSGVDDLIEQARAETDPAAQEELWKQANIQIQKDLAALPLYMQNLVYARAPGVDYGHELVSSLALYPQITELTTVER